MSKAFIFSIDAFVSFTFILIMLHSLIFLAAVPSSYYGGLMQANYLASDVLSALALSDASKVLGSDTYAGMSMLDYLVSVNTGTSDYTAVRSYIGTFVPDQYGYSLELWDSGPGSWSTIYDTKNDAGDAHNKLYHKLKVSSYSIFFSYTTNRGGAQSPFCYMTCNEGDYGTLDCRSPCDEPVSLYEEGKATLGLVRLTVYR